MMYFAGLDVSLKETAICVKDSRGTIVAEGAVASQPDAIGAFLTPFRQRLRRVGLETGPLAIWHWHALSGAGLPMVCMEARQAQTVLRQRPNKTDRNDARGLAELLRLDAYREVRIKSRDSVERRVLLRARERLVMIRRDLDNQVRGTLKSFGLVVGPLARGRFAERVRALIGDGGALAAAVEPLLRTREAIAREIAALDAEVKRLALADPVCRRLMTAPAIGPITAVAFVSAIDDPGRFAAARTVGAYLGMTPRLYQSGPRTHTGRISRAGDRQLRWLLFEAANVLLTRVKRSCALRVWGLRLAERTGAKRAKVAVARKLAVLLLQMWRRQEAFRWPAAVAATTAA